MESHPNPIRSQPRNLEAEMSILGAMLLDQASIPRVMEQIAAESFYQNSHRKIYDAVVSLYDGGTPADAITLVDALKTRGDLETAGGEEYIVSLLEYIPTTAHLDAHLKIVREKAMLRDLISTSTDVVNRCYGETTETAIVLDEVEKKFFQLTQRGMSQQMVPIRRLVKEVMEEIDARDGSHSLVTGLATGLKDLDDMTCGLQPSELTVLAGRPSMGKAQPLDAPVLTKAGWKTMTELRKGDDLASIDGQASIVTGIYPQGKRQVYRVTFSDGRSCEACLEHLWRVRYREWEEARVVDTQQLIKMIGRRRYQRRLWVDTFSGEFGTDEQLPLDPWLVGVLLGDGTLSGSSVRLSNADQGLVEMAGVAAGPGMQAAFAGGYDYRLTRQGGAHLAGVQGVQPNPIKSALRKLGLWDRRSEAKFIPELYKSADRESRRRLLGGLLDTDGWVERWGSIRLATSSRQLADDVVELTRSLGGTASHSKKFPAYTYRGRKQAGLPSFVCNIQLEDPQSLFTLEEKRKRLAAPRQRQRRLNIISIEPSRVTQTQCIAVSHPSRLYITEDYIPTHNTAFALSIAEHAAVVEKQAVGIFSLEMSSEALVRRMLCSNARVDAQAMRRGFLSGKDMLKLAHAAGRLSDAEIYIDDLPGATNLELRARARNMKARYDIKLLIIDYLQLLQATVGRSESRQQEVSDISRSLKSLARELEIPVLVLSQLNRGPEERPDRRPRLADLRESGAIEQDADLVVLIVRPGAYPDLIAEDPSLENMVYVNIAKQRNGPTGEIKLTFIKKYTKFEDYAEAEE